MSETVVEHLHLTKQQLVDLTAGGHVSQSGSVVLDHGFSMPTIDRAALPTMPSIETFVASAADRSLSSMGTNSALDEAWMPTVQALCDAVFAWLDEHSVSVAGDAYITASVTPASDVNGEAHFDDDQFMPTDGVGVVAIVADRAGSRVANHPVAIEDLRAPRPLSIDDATKQAFAEGTIGQDRYPANALVLFPQFGQLHSGPGPCGNSDEVRHLLVFRAATVPSGI